MKRKLSKNKKWLLIIISVIILILIYPCFIQRWTGSVNVNLSDIEKLGCFDNENPENIIKNVFEKSDGDTENYKKVSEGNGFSREIEVDTQFTSMQIEYTFTDEHYSTVKIYVAPKKAVADSISDNNDFYSGDLSDVNSYFALNGGKYDSVETLKSLLSEEIGKNRLIYDRFAKQGTVENVNYYISPQTANSRKTYLYMFPNKRLERTVFSVFEVGDYSISVCEIITFNDDSKYSIALNDFANLLQ